MKRPDKEPRGRILVIDDEKDLRDVLGNSLSKKEYHVETAASGEEGIEKAKAGDFDVVLCDIMMPGMGGIMTLETLKEQFPDLEVIMLTAFANVDSARTCKDLGARDFITKPCHIGPLCETLDKVIASRNRKPGPQKEIEEPKVLIIDDEEPVREMLVRALTERGYRVDSTSNGEKALEKVEKQKFDAIICDIMLPGIGGVMTLGLLKKRGPTEVIMVTGHPTVKAAEICEQLGAFDFITKPYELDALIKTLDKAIERTRSTGRAQSK